MPVSAVRAADIIIRAEHSAGPCGNCFFPDIKMRKSGHLSALVKLKNLFLKAPYTEHIGKHGTEKGFVLICLHCCIDPFALFHIIKSRRHQLPSGFLQSAQQHPGQPCDNSRQIRHQQHGQPQHKGLADGEAPWLGDEQVGSSHQAAGFVALVERYAALAGSLSVSELLGALLDESGYELALRTEGGQERLDNLAELKQSVHEFEISCGEEADPAAYLAHVALYTAGDLAEKGDRVKLMTVHAAKGLEFPHVFLCGMNEGIFPSRRVGTLEAMEEERRLCFVALTRAERGLWLSEAEGRNLDGSPRFPSRFLLDISTDLLVYDRAPAGELLKNAWEYIEQSAAALPESRQAAMLPPGTRVRHSVFGPGTVLDADADKGAHIIRFDGISTPRAVSFKAKLERLDG